MTATHLLWKKDSANVSGQTVESLRSLVGSKVDSKASPAAAGEIDILNDGLESPELYLCEEMDAAQLESLNQTGNYPPPRTAGVSLVEFCK